MVGESFSEMKSWHWRRNERRGSGNDRDRGKLIYTDKQEEMLRKGFHRMSMDYTPLTGRTKVQKLHFRKIFRGRLRPEGLLRTSKLPM